MAEDGPNWIEIKEAAVSTQHSAEKAFIHPVALLFSPFFFFAFAVVEIITIHINLELLPSHRNSPPNSRGLGRRLKICFGKLIQIQDTV